jgi:hypothetical protein
MFDEISLREHLHFNQKTDCIEGFEDLGSHGRISSIANRALFFMLRGLANHLNMRSGVNIVVVQ